MSKLQCVIADVLERAGWTAGQQFFAVLLAVPAGAGVIDLPWRLALAMAAGAAIVSVTATAIQQITAALAHSSGLSYEADLTLRLAKTFLASLLGAYGGDVFNVLTFDWSNAADLAVLATLAALAKGLLARGSASDSESQNPSTLAQETYRTAMAFS